MASLIYIFLIVINLAGFIYFLRAFLRARKKYKTQKEHIQKLEANKCKGPHSWISIMVEGEKTHVCRHCYWTPKHETFVKEMFVKDAIYSEQFDAEYKKYLDDKIQELSVEYGISAEKIAEIEARVYKIKQEFSIQYLKKMMEELNIGK
jgi:hypothetical protein